MVFIFFTLLFTATQIVWRLSNYDLPAGKAPDNPISIAEKL